MNKYIECPRCGKMWEHHRDKDCPDKLEPSKQTLFTQEEKENKEKPEQPILTSVLKNVPIELMWHLREYHSKPSHFEIKWRARQPVEGKKYGYGGDLKWEDARSGDMYVRDRSLEQKYQHLQDAHCVLRSEYDDLNDVHKSLSREYNDLMQDHCDKERGKDKEWTDEMSEQADKDYDAVTKGVISLINLLRR